MQHKGLLRKIKINHNNIIILKAYIIFILVYYN